MQNHRSLTLFVSLLVTLTTLSVSRTAAVEANPEQERVASYSVKEDDWSDSKRNRVIPVKIYVPDRRGGDKPCPILIFSHGLGGSRDAAAYLGEYLAQKGYMCVHIQHPGSDTGVARAALRSGMSNFRSTLGEAANGENLLLRIADVSFVIDELERRNQHDAVLQNRLDLNKIAVAGHSFGAGTALAICGQNYGFNGSIRTATDARVKAGIYLSAPVNVRGRSLSEVYGQIKVPGLLMTGTEDSSPIGGTNAASRRVPFDGITAPHQYLVNFIGGDHAIFGGRSFRATRSGDAEFHTAINKVSGAFLDAYLCGNKEAQEWLDGGGAKTYLAKTARFEEK